MQPQSAKTPKRGLVERAVIGGLVGLSVLSVLGAALATIYLDRLNASTAALARTDAMPGYVGRPAPVTAVNGNSPMNIVILLEDRGTLESVVVANLSASRRNLTLITVPADLDVSQAPGTTLVSTFAMDPAITVRAMEGVTAARMDHQVQVELGCLATAVDNSGGVQFGGAALNGADAVAAVRAESDAATRALTTGRLLRALLVSANNHYSPIDPARFSRMIDTAAPCLRVDEGLSAQVVEATIMEGSVHPEETRLWPLAVVHGTSESSADPTGLAELRQALASPNLAGTQEYHQAASLPQEAKR